MKLSRKFPYSIIVLNLFVLFTFSATSCTVPFFSKKATTKATTTPTTTASAISTTTPSATAIPTVTPTLASQTVTVAPTVSSGLYTNNTELGSVLNQGETWYQDGSEITLKDVMLVNKAVKGVAFTLEYKNSKSNQIAFNYKISNSITASNNLKKPLTILGYSNEMSYSDAKFGNTSVTKIVDKGETVNLSTYNYFLAQVDIGNSSINQIVVTVSNISNVRNAKWRIPLYH